MKINKQNQFEIAEILYSYSNWLCQRGYIDFDYYLGEPTAVNTYLVECLAKQNNENTNQRNK